MTVAAAHRRSTPRSNYGQTILEAILAVPTIPVTCMFGRDGRIRTAPLCGQSAASAVRWLRPAGKPAAVERALTPGRHDPLFAKVGRQYPPPRSTQIEPRIQVPRVTISAVGQPGPGTDVAPACLLFDAHALRWVRSAFCSGASSSSTRQAQCESRRLRFGQMRNER